MATNAEKDHEKNPIKRFLKIIGPGFIAGASDDDPSGIGTYAIAGASLGYATLWTAIACIPMMIAVQFTCAKIAMVSGRGLAGVIRKYYPRWILYLAIAGLVIANTINAGADIGAVAAAINMFVPIPIPAMILPISVIIVAFQILGSYRLIERIFKWLTLALLAYMATAFYAHPSIGEALSASFIPRISFDAKSLATLTAIFGTSISPFLFFWQATQEVEEEKELGRKSITAREGASKKSLRYAVTDVTIGMVFSCLVMYFIIFTTAATLFKAGKTDIKSATDAAEALRPLAGNGARILLGLGLIGAGLLAIPILTGSIADAVAEAMAWKTGLSEKLWTAGKFYAVIVISTLTAMQMNLLGINPISALFWAAVINGFVAPPLLVIIMLAANQKKIMGNWVNGIVTNIIGWATAVVMAAAAIALVLTWGKA